MATKAVIQLKDVWKTYEMGKVQLNALQNINLDIYKEDFLVVLGKSGSGKSTLMNMMGALDIPSSGTIYLDGKDISKFDESTLAQMRGKKIGFIFQQFNLMPVLDAVTNVELPMVFQNIAPEQRKKRAAQLLNTVGLGQRLYHKPTELSGGEQQRVSIARALANDPEIILADEPTGNLDTNTGRQIMDLLADLHETNNKTIVLITHDVNLVRYAHRVVRLEDGKIVKLLVREKEVKAHGKGHK